MDLIDLHTHSTFSDGTLTPAALVDLARQTGLKAIALTDHDTMAGLPEAVARGREQGIEVVPGVEVSAVHEGRTIHVLAYRPRESREMGEMMERLQRFRHRRNDQILANLNRLGIAVTAAELRHYSPSGQTGRPHIARLLVDRKVVKTVDQAFNRYLKKGGLAHAESGKLQAEEVVRTVAGAGGIPVLAHPLHGVPGLPALTPLLEILVPAGLAGLEAYYPSHSAADVRELKKLATRYGLLITGGSDFHGDSHAGASLGGIGTPLRIPYELLSAMNSHPASQEKGTDPAW
ncbi:MAG: PHP domain-containing protein [Desulfobacteraceae bacterium]|nr:PHP domain-containing protein [Desulfobacteraceae bacterium]